jgi:valyl-tRNA synthetase
MTLPKQYDHKEAEKRWQERWEAKKIYAWMNDAPREETFVIDTPPPTVSGILHMGHIFSYTQADFVARFQRMIGKDVFYPMGFDDNGLPTERLVEKTKKVRATDMSREDFIKLCMGVSEEARKEFRDLFTSVALSVDWAQEYHTISEHSRRISQASFLDLYNKGHAYRELKPFFWDPVDQTAIAQAEIIDKEMPSFFNDILFGVEGSDEKITIATTRPELLPACVGVFYHPDDKRYQHLKGKNAITPLFGVKVPILEDESVEIEKGTGIMMCCTFGDEKDIEKWKKHKLATRVILNKYGKIDLSILRHSGQAATPRDPESSLDSSFRWNDKWEVFEGKKVSNTDPKNLGAREIICEMLRDAGLLVEQKPITHAVKCAERSGAPLEILPTDQWFVRVMDKKAELKAKSDECAWHPEWMKHRMDQWIDGLASDWCISRQRYFGVPFPVWYARSMNEKTKHTILASPEELPVNPLTQLPSGFREITSKLPVHDGQSTPEQKEQMLSWRFVHICEAIKDIYNADGKLIFKANENIQIMITPDRDVMDTWATSSVSPQISAGAIHSSLRGEAEAIHGSPRDSVASDDDRFNKLFPADLRPQAHEIIRTWAFYTIVKAHLHSNSVPWHNLMISGWCLAADKTKMSKSKGNVVTPVDLIVDKGADVVRYWASTSRLGADTAFSEDLLKIGRKLTTKLWNATAFAAIHLSKIEGTPKTAYEDVADGRITEALDKWILARLHSTVKKATKEFEGYEYCDARVAIEEFFWRDFCDNYLELVKARAYGETGDAKAHASAHLTLHHCLNTILRLFAPFIPHVTEELFSHIFVDEYDKFGSLHARGMWPKANDYLFASEPNTEELGQMVVSLLEAIRKRKSEKNVSIKYPIDEIQLAYDKKNYPHIESARKSLAPFMEDLKSAGNVASIVWVEWNLEIQGGVFASGEAFHLQKINFAEQANVA